MKQKPSLLDRLKDEVTSNLEKVGLSKDNKIELRKYTSKTGIIQFHFSPSWYHGELPFYKLMFGIATSFYRKEGFLVDEKELNNEDFDQLKYVSATNIQNKNETYIITAGSGYYKGSFGIAIENLKNILKN